MPVRKTKSELLFEKICKNSGIVFRRIKSHGESRTPDYELEIAGNRIAVEVKQIDPKVEDRIYASAVESGFATQTRNPDDVAKRVRKSIKVSSGQLRQYLINQPDVPALLVIFDAADNSYTDPYVIKVACFDHEQIIFSIPGNSTVPVIKESGFAPENLGRLRTNKPGRSCSG